MAGAVDVIVRPYELDDAIPLFEAAIESIADVQPWMPWCHPRYTLQEAKAWLDAQVAAFGRGTTFEFAVVSSTGRYLGGCGLNQIDRENRRANLGYWVRSTATRRGVATRAAQLVRDWGFENSDLIRLEIVVAAENAASRRVAEKAGAVYEGTLRNRLLLHGVAYDAAIFSYIRPVIASGA
jgi:ribosomal-protein-serine acetyltransferase